MMISNLKRQGMTIQYKIQPSLGDEKIVQLVQRCFRAAGVYWGLQEWTDKQGTQLKTPPHLHKDARNELQAEEAMRPKARQNAAG